MSKVDELRNKMNATNTHSSSDLSKLRSYFDNKKSREEEERKRKEQQEKIEKLRSAMVKRADARKMGLFDNVPNNQFDKKNTVDSIRKEAADNAGSISAYDKTKEDTSNIIARLREKLAPKDNAGKMISATAKAVLPNNEEPNYDYMPGNTTVIGGALEKGVNAISGGFAKTQELLARNLAKAIGDEDSGQFVKNSLDAVTNGKASMISSLVNLADKATNNKVSDSVSKGLDSYANVMANKSDFHGQNMASIDKTMYSNNSNIFIPKTLDIKKKYNWISRQMDKEVDYENIPNGKQIVGDIATSVVQMMPAFIPGIGSALFGITSGGNYAEQAEQKGANLGQQTIAATVGGIGEAFLTGWVVKGITGMFGTKATEELLKTGTKNLIKHFGKNYLLNMAKEGLEEVVMDPIMGMTEKVTYNPDLQWFTTGKGEAVVNLKNMGYSGLLGMLTAGVLELPSVPIQVSQGVQIAKGYKEYIEDTYPQLQTVAMAMPENFESRAKAESMAMKEPTYNDVVELQDLVRKDLEKKAEIEAEIKKQEAETKKIEGQKLVDILSEMVAKKPADLIDEELTTLKKDKTGNKLEKVLELEIAKRKMNTNQGYLPEYIKRIEVGADVLDLNKPQGLYTSDASVESLLNSQNTGQTKYFKVNPKAKILRVGTDMVDINRGYADASAGIMALKELISDEMFNKYSSMSKKVLSEMLSKEYPKVEWSRYTDQTEMLEGLAGILAKEKGYDAIFQEDKTDKSHKWDEFVILNKNAYTESRDYVKESKFKKTLEEVAGIKKSLDEATGIIQDKVANNADNKTNKTDNETESKKKSDGTKAFINNDKNKVPVSYGDGTKKIYKRSDIVKIASKYLKVPISTGKSGKFRRRPSGVQVLGFYRQNIRTIRLKKAKDLNTMFHEIGHHFDEVYGFSRKTSIGINEAVNQLPESFKNLYSVSELKGEAVAEFMRHLIVRDIPANESYPYFYDEFLSTVSKEDLDFINLMRAAVKNYYEQDPQGQVLSNLSINDKTKKSFNFETFYRYTIDDLKPLERMSKQLLEGKSNITADPYKQAWLFRGWKGRANTFLEYGVVDENFNKVGKSFKEILDPVKKEMDSFRAYIVSKRSLELNKRGIETGIDKNIAEKTLLANADKAAKYDRIFIELQKFQDDVLMELVNNQIMSKESYAEIKKLNKEYIPFYRVMEDVMEQRRANGTGKKLQGRNPVKKIKGSAADIVDPLESIIKNVYTYINLAEKNRIALGIKKLVDTSKGGGQFMEKVATPMNQIKFNLEEIKNALINAGAETVLDQNGRAVPKDIDLSKIASIFRPANYNGKDMYTIYVEGKPQYYEVHDKPLFEALQALDRESSNVLIKILAMPAKILRASAVATPEFVARNPMRDSMSAFMFSKYGFIPGIDTLRGLAHVLKKGDTYYKWMASGGAQATLVSMDRDYLQKEMRNVLGSRLGVLSKQSKLKAAKEVTKNIITSPLHLLQAVSEFSEEATRLGEFSKGLKKEGMTRSGIQEAALASRDVTLDFARMGSKMAPVNQTIAFFNASLQGTDKMIRSFKSNPVKTSIRALMSITLPSIALFIKFHDDERYQEVPQWEKDTFWIIPTDKTIYRIPKPFEMGLLYGTVPERFLQYAIKEDPTAFDGLPERFADTFFTSIIPTALLPYVEALSNYSFFKGYNIVPDSQKYYEPWAQYSYYTSDTAKLLGKALNVSPRIIENTIYDIGAGLSRYGIDVIDVILEATNLVDKNIMPKETIDQLPLIKGFTDAPYSSAKSIDDFYKRYNELNSQRITPNADPLTTEELREYNRLKATYKVLSDLRKQINLVYEHKYMTPEEKRKKLDDLNYKMVKYARRALGRD